MPIFLHGLYFLYVLRRVRNHSEGLSVIRIIQGHSLTIRPGLKNFYITIYYEVILEGKVSLR